MKHVKPDEHVVFGDLQVLVSGNSPLGFNGIAARPMDGTYVLTIILYCN